ncbi:AlbA family DNA-binding domain-containing protein [Megalodesulfovibrio paquesii]
MAPMVDIVKRETGFALHQDGAVARTPAGRELASPSLRLLELVVRDACEADPDTLTARELLEAQLDEVEPAAEEVRQNLLQALATDPLVARRFPGMAGAAAPAASALLLEVDLPAMFLQFGGLVEAFDKAVAFLLEHDLVEYPAVLRDFESFSRAVAAVLQEAPPERLAVLGRLTNRHQVGVLLPILLSINSLSPSEYAGVAACLRLDCSKAGPAAEALARYRALRRDAWTVREYLSAAPAPRRLSLRQLIAEGESYHLEFKSTLRLNLQTNKHDTAITHASLKTLAAFLNSGGGTLLIGVRDDGSVHGLAADGFPNLDRFGLHFWQVVESGLGGGVCPYVATHFEETPEGTVCVATCRQSPAPVFLQGKSGEDEFFIRVGCSSRKLGVRDALEYISLHFKKT